MVLVQKQPFFQLFFLGNIGQQNVFYDILERKNVFLGYKNKKFQKSKNPHFSKWVNPWFQSKNGHISNIFFQALQPRKMSFTIFYNEKTPFQAIKTQSSRSRKIDIFQKGLTHAFWSNNGHFSNFFFRQYRPAKCLLRYSTTKKTPFQAIKTKSSKNRSIEIFPNGLTNGFGPKMAFFHLFLRQYRLAKCLLRYSRTKKRLSRL